MVFLQPPLAAVQVYGLLIAAAVALAAWLVTREEKRLGLPKDTGLDLVLYAVPLAVVFSRLYYVAFTWDEFAQQPLRIFYVWEGGLAIYGGVIGGALGVWLLSRRRGIRFPLLADVVAPALLLGQAVGRWGNYFNGEAFGYAVTNPALQFFPVAVYVNGTWHMATFFYESLWNLMGFVFLYTNRQEFQTGGRTGHVFLWYLVWYGLGRMYIEGLRTDSLMWGTVRVSQLLSLLLCAGGLAALARSLRPCWLVYMLLAVSVLAAVAFLFMGGWWTALLTAAGFVASGVLLYLQYPRVARDA